MAIEKNYGKNARVAFNANKNLKNSYISANRLNDLNRSIIRPSMNIDDYMKNNSVSLKNSKLIKPIIDTSNIGVDNSTRPIGSMRETIKPIMDIDEYFKLERRDNFDFDKIKQDFADTPIRDIENMFVHGTGDFGEFYNRNLNTPLSELENTHSDAFDMASKYSTQRKEYTPSQQGYDMEVGDYISRVDSQKDNFSYNNIYDSTDDVDNYHGMYGNVSSEIGVVNKPYEYQGKIKDLSINGTQAQSSDVKIDDVYNYNKMIDDDIDNYHSMYGQVSDEIDVGDIGIGIVQGKYEDQMSRIQNDYYDSVRVSGSDLNKNGYQMQGIESSNLALSSDFSSKNVKLNKDVVENNITGYGSESYIDNWRNNNKNSLFSDYLQTQSSSLDELNKDFGLDKLVNRIKSGKELRQFEKDDIDFFKKELSGIYDRSVEKAKELGIDNIDDFDEIKRINAINSYLNVDREKINDVNNDFESKTKEHSEILNQKRVEETNNRIDAEQQAYNDELEESQRIVDERKNKAYEDWKNEKNNVKQGKNNYDFKKRFGTTKKKYAGEVEELFEKEGHVYDDVLNKIKKTSTQGNIELGPELSQEMKMMNDDIYFQYDKNDEFYKDVNILDKLNMKKNETNSGNVNWENLGQEFDGSDDEVLENPNEEVLENPNEEKVENGTESTETTKEQLNRIRSEGGKVNTKFKDGKEVIDSVEYEARNNNTKTNFDYNTATKDTINAREYAKTIYGKDVTDAQVKQLVEGYAESDDGIKKQLYQEGFDYNKVNMKTTGDNAESIGRVIADLKGDGVISKDGVFDTDKAIKTIQDINGPFNKEEVLKGFKSQAYKNRFYTEYKAKENDFIKMSEDLNNSKNDVKDIVKKIQNGETLTPEEAKAFHKHQVKLKTYQDEIINWAEERGFDSESIFGKGFKTKGKTKSKGKDNKKYKGTRDWAFNKNSINNINNELDILNTRVNLETGEYVNKQTEVKNNLKNDLGSLLNNNDYKQAYENSNIKDNYLDYLKDNQDALSDDAKKLYRLQQQGVDIGDEGKQVLQGLAIAHQGGLKDDNGAVKKLNTAVETLSSEGYMNISDENIDRVGKDLTYENGKYKLRDLNLTDTQKEKYKDVINSNNVGKSNLKDALDAEKIKNVMDEKNINEEAFNKTVKERFAGLKNSEKSTGYNIKEQLINSGVDEKIAEEIYNHKKNKTDNLSTDAKIELANMSGPIDQNTANFGRLSADEMKEMVKNNKSFFGGNADIDNMDEKTLRKLFGDAFANTVDGASKDGVLSMGYKFKTLGKDVTTSKGFTEFYDSILGKDGKDLDWEKVFKSIGATEEGKAKFEDMYKWAKEGKDISKFRQLSIANDARDYLVKMFESASEMDDIDATKKEQLIRHAKELKTKKMEDVANIVDVDKITEGIGKYDKLGKKSASVVSKAAEALGGKGKTIGYAAAGMAVLGGLGMMASNAAEERERKRQEMQQLMMAQNQSIRNGY